LELGGEEDKRASKKDYKIKTEMKEEYWMRMR
jgi:hypothetical protein